MEFNPCWVYLVSFVDLFAVSLSIPLLTAHLRSLGASHVLIGLCSSLFAGAQLISGPIVGSWSDQKGRRLILLISLAICSTSYIFLGTFQSLFLVLLIRVGLGIFKHTQVLTRTIIADRVSPEEQGRVSGRLTALSSAGFIVGPAIGGHLIELENGFTYLCYCTASLFATNIAITYLFLHDPPESQSSDESKPSKQTIRDSSIRQEIVRAVRHLANVDWAIYGDVFALKLLMAISQATFISNYSINIQERFNISPKWTGYTISVQGLVAALASLLAGWLDEKFYKNDLTFRQRNLHGFIVMSLSYIGLFFAPTLSFFMLWTVPFRASCSFLRITGTAMMLQRCLPTQRGSLVGTGNSITNVARLVAPLLAGIMGDLYGTSSTILLSIIMSSLGVILSLTVRRYEPTRSKME